LDGGIFVQRKACRFLLSVAILIYFRFFSVGIAAVAISLVL
jgi:hypothetical protein